MEFKEVNIGSIAKKIFSGGTPDTRNLNYWNGNLRWLSSGETRKRFIFDTEKKITQEGVNNSSTKLAHKGSIVIASAGQGLTRGQTSLLMNDMYINQSLVCIECNESVIDNYYLFYLLSSQYNKLRFISNENSSRGSLTTKLIKEYIIEILPLKYQVKISNILKYIDKKITVNNEINNNLYKICNSIFHSFLDKYSNLIVNTKLGEIVKKIITGKTPSTKNKEFWDGNIPFITIPDMHDQVFTLNTERTISKLGAKSMIPKNSISVSCIATIGLVSITTEESQTNQQINSIIVNNDYDLYYLFEFLSEQTEYLKSIAGGSTTYNINKKTFENIVIPYLPEHLLKKFNEEVSCLFERIKGNQIENKNLEQLRDTLLPRLMNGEIDLDNIEI